MATFFLGELVRVKAIFATAAGVADPDEVYFQYRHENGAPVSLTYGVNPQLVKLATGTFYTEINATLSGEWFWEWRAEGDGKTAEQGSFTIEQSYFA